VLAELFADALHRRREGVGVEDHFHHADLCFPFSRVALITNILLEYVVHGESQRDSRERACIRRIAVAYSLGINLRAFGVGGTEDDHNVFRSEFLSRILDALLILQVQRALLPVGEDHGGVARRSGRRGHEVVGVARPEDRGLRAPRQPHDQEEEAQPADGPGAGASAGVAATVPPRLSSYLLFFPP